MIHLATRAYRRLLLEVLGAFQTETGGALLGELGQDQAWAVESIDPGPRAVLEPAYFEFDHEYMTHLANRVAAEYRQPPRLIGLWHRHPGSLDRFSSLDHRTNHSFAALCGGLALSGLVNLDPDLRLTFYEVEARGEPGEHVAEITPEQAAAGLPGVLYRRLPVSLGDAGIPEAHLARRTPRALEGEIRERARGRLEEARQGFLGRIKRRAARLAGRGSVEDGRQLPLLDALEEELLFLDAQPDYSYQLHLVDRQLFVTLFLANRIAGYPLSLTLRFFQDREGLSVDLEGTRFPFHTGILRELMSSRIDDSKIG